MGFFSRKQLPDMPPLVELPEAGEPIIFDDEEQSAIDNKIKHEFDTQFQNVPKEAAEILSQEFAADALRNITQLRLSRNDLKGAASSNIKVLGTTPVIKPSDWLLLAKIFALHGDSIRAKSFISEANNTHKESGIDKIDSYVKEGWKIRIAEVTNIIDAIQR
ncbi:hypothetical protein ACFLTT_00200 [Chloroflexota bacterium]